MNEWEMKTANFSVGLTSYDAMMHFVVYDPFDKSKCDTSGILQRPCYDLWLKTRRIVPGNPEESFRRHLTSFLTGSKKRKPFPSEVEKDLLPRLRQRRIWPCFKGCLDHNGKEITIGRTGFRAQGYWEQRTVVTNTREEKEIESEPECDPLILDVPLNHFIQDVTPPSVQFEDLDLFSEHENVFVVEDRNGLAGKKRELNEDSLCTWFIETMTAEYLESHQNTPSKRQRLTKYTLESLETLFDKAKQDPVIWERMENCRKGWENDLQTLEQLLNSFNIDPSEFVSVSDTMFSNSLVILKMDSKPTSFRGALVKAFCHVSTPQYFQMLQQLYMGGNPSLKCSKLVHLRLDEAKNDPRFSPSFRFVYTSQPWDLNRPIGRSCFSARNGVYLKNDLAAQQIMRGDFTGYTTAGIPKSLISFWMSFTDIVPVIISEGKCLFQGVSRRLDGTKIVLRMEYTLRGDKVYSTFQEVTHLYNHLLALPDLQ